MNLRTSTLCLFSLLISIVLCCLTLAPAYAAGPIYVKPHGNGNGSSWAAAAGLQAALGSAANGDEIWVSSGIYTPGVTSSATFTLPPGVGVYGGFAGTETLRTQRDWLAHLTILSGDIGGDDSTDANGVVVTTTHIVGANAYHVVMADGTGAPITGTTVLDGFTITGGQANGGSAPDDSGGGFYCDGHGSGHVCSPSLRNLTFSGNAATGGGAMVNDGQNGGNSSPSLTNVTFFGNTTAASGGAMVNDGRNGGNSSPSLTNVTFAGNIATALGGAMVNDGDIGGSSSPSLTHVTFSGNMAFISGGAIYNDGDGGDSSPSLTNVTFSGNTAQYGGGAMVNSGSNGGNSSPTLDHVTFAGNSASQGAGGAMINSSGGFGGSGSNSSPSLTNVTFSSNTANIGGAIYSYGSNGGGASPSLDNVTFSRNAAITFGGAIYSEGSFGGSSNASLTNVTFFNNTANTGGAMYSYGNSGGISDPRLTNVTFASNTATIRGGAMVNEGSFGGGGSNASLHNTILWGNSANTGSQMYNNSAGADISTSLVQGGVNGPGIVNVNGYVTGAGGNLDADPHFVDAAAGNLRLRLDSPAIDAGDDNVMPFTTDLDGKPRFFDMPGVAHNGPNIVDLGAYELNPQFILLPGILR